MVDSISQIVWVVIEAQNDMHTRTPACNTPEAIGYLV